MSLLSKGELQFLQGQKQVSKSYEYKLKSILRKKISNFLDKDLPLLSPLFPNLDLTRFSKVRNIKKNPLNLTKNSKTFTRTLSLYQDCNKELDSITPNTTENHKIPSHSNCREKNEQLYIKSKKKINNYNTRAGGLAWLRYRLDMAGVVGSNPTRPKYVIGHFPYLTAV
jgi:hypothetical protein